MYVIALANQKGGVSKTTSTQAIATLLNKKGKKRDKRNENDTVQYLYPKCRKRTGIPIPT